MVTPKKTKFVKAKKAEVKVHLGKKKVELVISLPEAVTRNLARRLKKRFSD